MNLHEKPKENFLNSTKPPFNKPKFNHIHTINQFLSEENQKSSSIKDKNINFINHHFSVSKF
jgi:hypothetical protein